MVGADRQDPSVLVRRDDHGHRDSRAVFGEVDKQEGRSLTTVESLGDRAFDVCLLGYDKFRVVADAKGPTLQRLDIVCQAGDAIARRRRNSDVALGTESRVLENVVDGRRLQRAGEEEQVFARVGVIDDHLATHRTCANLTPESGDAVGVDPRIDVHINVLSRLPLELNQNLVVPRNDDAVVSGGVFPDQNHALVRGIGLRCTDDAAQVNDGRQGRPDEDACSKAHSAGRAAAE